MITTRSRKIGSWKQLGLILWRSGWWRIARRSHVSQILRSRNSNRKPLPSTSMSILLLFSGILFVFMGALMTSQVCGGILNSLVRAEAAETGRIAISYLAYNRLAKLESQRLRWREDMEAQGVSPSPGAAPSSLVQRVQGALESALRIASIHGGEPITENEETAWVEHGTEEFLLRGIHAFMPLFLANTVMEDDIPIPAALVAPLFRALEVVFLLLLIFLVAASLGTGRTHLGKEASHLEWLFTVPVPAHTIFLSETLRSLINPLLWAGFTPVMVILFRVGGWGHWRWVAAPVSVACTALLMGGMATWMDLWVSKRLRVSMQKNLQGMLSVVGGLGWLGLWMWMQRSQPLPPWLVDFVRRDDASIWPMRVFTAPIAAVGLPPDMRWAVLGLVVLAVGWAWGFAWLAAREVRTGLVLDQATFVGQRPVGVLQPGRPSFFRGMVQKELRLLGRDRAYLAQTVILPLAVMGIQLSSPLIWKQFGNSGNGAASLAFLVCSYAALMAAARMMESERPGLWLLATLPQPLDRVLRQKAWVLAGGLTILCTCMLAVGLARVDAPSLPHVAAALASLALVPIFTFVAVASHAASDLEGDGRGLGKTARTMGLMLMFMFLASQLYRAEVWPLFVTVVLFGLLAQAAWQAVAQRVQYLLDPDSVPAPVLCTADGLWALVWYFVIQVSGSLLFVKWWDWPGGKAVAVASFMAGALVMAGNVLAFHRRGMRDWARQVGLPGLHSIRPMALVVGVVLGGFAALVARFYLEWIATTRWMPDADAVHVFKDQDAGWWFVMIVVAAPIIEELIFRGVVLNGLRRSFTPAISVVLTAVLFASVHNPVSVFPVGMLGLAAGFGVLSTGSLVTGVVAHVVYNALVVGM